MVLNAFIGFVILLIIFSIRFSEIAGWIGVGIFNVALLFFYQDNFANSSHSDKIFIAFMMGVSVLLVQWLFNARSMIIVAAINMMWMVFISTQRPIERIEDLVDIAFFAMFAFVLWERGQIQAIERKRVESEAERMKADSENAWLRGENLQLEKSIEDIRARQKSIEFRREIVRVQESDSGLVSLHGAGEVVTRPKATEKDIRFTYVSQGLRCRAIVDKATLHNLGVTISKDDKIYVTGFLQSTQNKESGEDGAFIYVTSIIHQRE